MSIYLLHGHIGIPKKMTSSFREGGKEGQSKDDTGLCGGRGGGVRVSRNATNVEIQDILQLSTREMVPIDTVMSIVKIGTLYWSSNVLDWN